MRGVPFQYQGKAEPVGIESLSADATLIGWYRQPSEPVRTPRHLTRVGMYTAPVGDVDTFTGILLGWAPNYPGPILGGHLMQYQSRAEVIGIDTLNPDPALMGWFRQASEPVRVPEHLARPGLWTGILNTSIFASGVHPGLEFTLPPNRLMYTVPPSKHNFTLDPEKHNFTVPPEKHNFTLPPEAEDFSI